MKDTQDREPTVSQDLEKVGVTNLKTLVKTDYYGKKYRFVVDTSLTINLNKSKKGVHMSRLIESVIESVEEESRQIHSSLEQLGKDILTKLLKKHPHTRSEVTFKTDLVVYSKTPVTNKDTMESHEIKVKVIYGDEKFSKDLSVKVLGNTVCPHSMEYAGKPHIQRAYGVLSVRTEFENKIDLENLISLVENSFSSPVYTLLKTEDEAKVVNDMHANPLFVEDVCRNIIDKASEIPDATITSKVISEESIHRHDVTAETTIKT